MVNDVQDAIRHMLINAMQNVSEGANSATETVSREGNSRKALAATVAAAAIAPIALKGAGKLAAELGVDTLDVIRSPEQAFKNLTANVGDRVGAGIGDKVSQKVDEFGGPSAILKDSVKSALPFGGGGDATKGGALGVGKGRRMPVQQSVDIGVPLEAVYNQWTQYELWPDFMHRVARVTREDDCTVSFGVKVWGRTREFTASIETQRADERIKWKVTEGMALTGVVTFHQLGPRLTRVLLALDLEPGSMVEKAGRGLRHVKRAARGDLHRFKAFIEMQEVETGAWRGRIEDGVVVEEHGSAYDKGRDYSDPKAMFGERDEGDPSDRGDRGDQQDDEPRGRRRGGGQRSSGRDRTANRASSAGGQRSRASGAASGSRRAAGRSGQRQRSAPRSSGRTSDTKTRGRQATRKNS